MESEKNPWQVLASKEIYENKWLSLTEFDVINPGGGKGIYGKVHFKNRAIGVLALDKDFNTYLVGQFRFVLDEYSWEIPEGGGPFNEEPVNAAKRELLEETGLIAHDWQLLLKMHLSNSVTDELAWIFLARNLEQRTAMPEETEQLVTKKLPFEEVWQLVKEGIITDSITVAAVQQVKLMLLNGELASK